MIFCRLRGSKGWNQFILAYESGLAVVFSDYASFKTRYWTSKDMAICMFCLKTGRLFSRSTFSTLAFANTPDYHKGHSAAMIFVANKNCTECQPGALLSTSKD